MDVNLVDLLGDAGNWTPLDIVSGTHQSFDTAIISLVKKRHWPGRMGSPSVSARAASSPEVTNIGDILRRPSGKVVDVLNLGLTVVLVATASDGSIPGVLVGVVLWCNVVRFAHHDHLGNLLGEIIVQSEVVVVIGSNVESILLPSTIVLDKVHDDSDTLINVQHGSQHVVHVVRMGSPVNLR